MELIKDLGLEVYPQFSAGKKVLHMGGPTSKVRAYQSSFPTLSLLALLDTIQLMWKVRHQKHTMKTVSQRENSILTEISRDFYLRNFSNIFTVTNGWRILVSALIVFCSMCSFWSMDSPHNKVPQCLQSGSKIALVLLLHALLLLLSVSMGLFCLKSGDLSRMRRMCWLYPVLSLTGCAERFVFKIRGELPMRQSWTAWLCTRISSSILGLKVSV